ncbi:MAG: PEGA domain-containing protein [Planctomycetota bacterium]|nr:PEGA domain-containing protein [Planctomycetota bacterium]
MKNLLKRVPITVAAACALALAGCGDSPSGGGGNTAGTQPVSRGNTAQVTFRTDPAGAEVWIDGTSKGRTPLVAAVDAGSHAIEFKATGFEPISETLAVEAGKNITVKTGMTVTGDDEARVKTLLAALGIPEHDNLEGKVHRAAMKNGVMLYWPQADVRKEGLATWRLEIGSDYEDDGFLVFKKGKDTLHREPFLAQSMVTEGALPATVIEALKRGATITWGVEFEDKRKKDVLASFKVVDGKPLDRKLDKLMDRSVFRRADDLERELAKIELKRNYRFYTEALTDAMSVLNTWPETQLADKVIVDSLQRLDLKESMLYVAIMSRVGSSGREGAKAKAAAGGAKGAASGLGDVSTRLPESLVAPKVHKPEETASKGGMKAGGLGVTPTGGNATEAPGTTATPGSDGSKGVGVSPAEAGRIAEEQRRAHVLGLQQQLADAEATAAESAEAESRMRDAIGAFEQAKEIASQMDQAVTDAEQDVRDAETAGDAAAIAAAKAKLDDAIAKAAKAQEHLRDTEQAKDDLAQTARKVMQENGTSDEAKARIEQLKREIEQAKLAGENEPTNPDGLPRPDRVAEDPLAEPGEEAYGVREEDVLRERVQQDVTNAEQQTRNAKDWIDNATQAQQTASSAYDAANAALTAAEAAGDAAAIAAAEAALGQAHQDLQRATMELERANGTYQRASDELDRAKGELDKFDQDAPAREAAKSDPAAKISK